MSKDGNRICRCLWCHQLRRHHARGLCKTHYNKASARHLLDSYPIMAVGDKRAMTRTALLKVPPTLSLPGDVTVPEAVG